LLLALGAVYQRYSGESVMQQAFWRASVKAPNGTTVFMAPDGRMVTYQEMRAAEMARFAETFFSTFMIVQLLVVLLLTPAYTAGVIAEEKDRKRVEFLLSTDLKNREIVLGKLAACLANLTLLILTGLPILSLTQLLGGVDVSLLLAGFIATGLTMTSLAAISILNSVYAQKPRDAIVLTYLAVMAYLMLSFFSLAPLGAFMPPRPPPPRFPWMAGGPPPPVVKSLPVLAIEAFNSGNLFIQIMQLREEWDRGTSLTTILPEVLWSYAAFHGLVTVICTGWAVARMRALALSPPRRRRIRPRLHLAPHWLRPKLGRQPMVWKEVFAEPGLRFNWFGRIIVALIVLVSFAPAVWIVGQFVLLLISGPANGHMWDELADTVNRWVRLVGTIVATLTLLGVAIRAAGSVSGERDRQTLDSLMSTPLQPEAVLYAKWLGSILSVRWAWAWLCLIWTVAALLGGLSAVTLPWLLLTWLVYAAFAASLGMRFSITSPTTLRATLMTLGTLAVLWFVHWLPRFVWEFGPANRHWRSDDLWGWFLDFQMYGMTPPVAFSWLAFHGDKLFDPNDWASSYLTSNPMTVFVGIVFGMLVWSLAAYVLWRRGRSRFRAALGRMPRRLEKALDYPERLKPAPVHV
jgi:ABC-type transport system involved in multi-copper enzyme maturation permease subunit